MLEFKLQDQQNAINRLNQDLYRIATWPFDKPFGFQQIVLLLECMVKHHRGKPKQIASSSELCLQDYEQQKKIRPCHSYSKRLEVDTSKRQHLSPPCSHGI